MAWNPARHKYRAKPTRVNNIWFPSQKEANRYKELILLEKIREITSLRRQVSFPLDVNGVHICEYRADFVYLTHDKQNGGLKQVIEDVKGFKTPEYKLKKKLFEAIYPLKITEL